MEEVDVKIIKDIMNTKGEGLEGKIATVYSFLRYLKSRQEK